MRPLDLLNSLYMLIADKFHLDQKSDITFRERLKFAPHQGEKLNSRATHTLDFKRFFSRRD